MEELKKLYNELLPWEKVEFCEWIKEQEEFEIDSVDLENAEITTDDIIDRFCDEELLKMCDESSVVNYIFDCGLETDVVDEMDEEYLAEYIKRNIPGAMQYLLKEEVTDRERNRIFDVAYDQGFRDGKSGKKNKCNPGDF